MWPAGRRPPEQIAKGFGLQVTTLRRWIATAGRKVAGTRPASPKSVEVLKLKELNRLLEQENEILLGAASYRVRDINPK